MKHLISVRLFYKVHACNVSRCVVWVMCLGGVCVWCVCVVCVCGVCSVCGVYVCVCVCMLHPCLHSLYITDTCTRTHVCDVSSGVCSMFITFVFVMFLFVTFLRSTAHIHTRTNTHANTNKHKHAHKHTLKHTHTCGQACAFI